MSLSLKKPLLLFLISTLLGAHSQTFFLGHKIVPSPEKAAPRNFDQIKYRQQVLKKYQDLIQNPAELSEFTDFQVSVKKFYLKSNTEYEQEDSAIAYLKKICDRINPFDTPLNIRITRDPTLNACAFEDGTIYVNIGLLAKYNNEAEIAAVLGHEIGHIIKLHNYKSYDIYKDIYEISFNSPYRNQGAIVTLLNAKHSFNKLVKQEEESDDVSIEFLKKSQYNTKALCSIEEKFIELEKKSKATVYYEKQSGFVYFRTHPSSEKRLQKARKVEDNGGRNFLVDSVYFQRLKRWAIDESILLNFEGQNFLLCIELAFNEHLKFPNDPFYLFYLTEATRRAIEYYDLDKTEFISGLYKNEFVPIANGKDSIYVTGLSGIKKVRRSSTNSILLKLNGSILSFGGEDFKNYQNTDLLNEDTLEFNTYPDALNYFVKLNKKKGFRLNNLFFENACDISGLNEKEKEFQSLKCVDGKLTPNANENKNILFVLFDVSHLILEQNATVFDRSSSFKMNHNRRDVIIEKLKTIDSGLLSFGENMGFNDRNAITNYIDLFSGLIDDQKEKVLTQGQAIGLLFGKKPDLITRDSSEINAQDICPELIPMLNKYNYTGVLFSSIAVKEETMKGMYGSGAHTETWKVRHYYFDLKQNKIRFYLSSTCVSWEHKRSWTTNLPQCFYETIKEITK